MAQAVNLSIEKCSYWKLHKYLDCAYLMFVSTVLYVLGSRGILLP